MAQVQGSKLAWQLDGFSDVRTSHNVASLHKGQGNRLAQELGSKLVLVQGSRLVLVQELGSKLALEQVQDSRLVLEQVLGSKLALELGSM